MRVCDEIIRSCYKRYLTVSFQTDLSMEDGTTFVCEASNTYGRDQFHVTVELGGIRKSFIEYLLKSIEPLNAFSLHGIYTIFQVRQLSRIQNQDKLCLKAAQK